MGDSGIAPLVAIGLGVVFLLVGIGLGLLNGVILGAASPSNATQGAESLSGLEVFGFVVVGIFGIVLGAFMAKDP